MYPSGEHQLSLNLPLSCGGDGDLCHKPQSQSPTASCQATQQCGFGEGKRRKPKQVPALAVLLTPALGQASCRHRAPHNNGSSTAPNAEKEGLLCSETPTGSTSAPRLSPPCQHQVWQASQKRSLALLSLKRITSEYMLCSFE